MAVGAGAAGRLATSEKAYEANALHVYRSDDYLDLAGTLSRSPGREAEADVLLIRVDTLWDKGRELRVAGTLRLAVPFARDSRDRLRLHAGDRVRFSARMPSGGAFRNFGGFSYDRYLRGQGIHRRASTKSSLLVSKLAGGAARSLRARISRVRCALQEELERIFPSADGRDISPEGAVLEALLLGEDGRMDEAMILALQATGLYHLFAISGGHIAIISFLLYGLFKALRLGPRTSAVALIVFLLFYTLLVEGSPSVLRATLMALALLIGKLLWKDVQILNTISASAFVLLLANPSSLFDAGFQLTYAATLAIILFAPPLIERLPKLPLKLAELTALSAAAMLGVLPIMAGNFNRVTFVSLALNYAAIPLTGLIMGLGYVFLPVAAIAPAAAVPGAVVLRALVGAFTGLAHVLDPLPFLAWRVPTPRWWTVPGYFLFLGIVLVRPRFRGQRAAAIAVFLGFFAILVIYPFPSVSPDLRLTLIDVGQGDSILVEFPGTRKMLIDGGGFAAGRFDVGEKVVSPFLWRRGIKRIDILVLTHPHPDHLNGLAAVARNFRIGELWEGSPARDVGAYRELAKALDRRAVRKRVGRGVTRNEGEVTVAVLHPREGGVAGEAGEANDRSVVLRISFGDVSFLLPGDVGEAGERGIAAEAGDIRSTVLKAGHHGSASSSSGPFLEAVQPAIVLFSVGGGNTYGFPNPAVLERYRSAGARIFRTDRDGAVELRTDGLALRVRTAGREAAPRLPAGLSAPGGVVLPGGRGIPGTMCRNSARLSIGNFASRPKH